MRCRSFAKINLHLQVLGRRADGYHELLTVFQTIDWHDVLTLEDAPPGEVRLTVRGSDLDAGPANLAHRAAASFLRRYRPPRGVSIEVDKRVPMGAGLGGGSANAATVLLALRRREGRPERVEDLAPLARDLGADVPYFLVGGTALGTGRGDEVRALVDLPEEAVLLALPEVHLATPEVFAAAAISPSSTPTGVTALLAGIAPPSLAAVGGVNDLEAAAFALRPELRRVPGLLLGAGAERALMSGSGSCFVGYLPQRAGAEPRAADSGVAGVRLIAARTLNRRSLGERASAPS